MVQVTIPDSLKAPCVSTVDVSGAQTVGDLGNAIVQGDADLRVCDVRREARDLDWKIEREGWL